MVFIPPSSSGSAKRIRNVTVSGTAPTANQVLTASSATAASWAAASGSTDGWTADSNTWTYSSVDGATGIVTINADLTGVIQAGDRIKLTQTTAKYFIVTKTPTFSSPNTTITMWGGTDYTLANAAITLPYYSHAKSPFGMNIDPAKWTVTTTNTANTSQASPVNGTWYNIASINIVIPIGVWYVDYQTTLDGWKGSASNADLNTALSTANNSRSNSTLSNRSYHASVSADVMSNHSAKDLLTLASKTTYYLNCMSNADSLGSINMRGDFAIIIIRAVCAYL